MWIASHVEEGILDVAAEDVAGHELCRRHVLQRSLGENLAGHLGLCQFQQETVLEHRVHLEGVSESHLLLRQTGDEGQLLVDDIGGKHGMCSFDGIGCGQVVVLAGIDDDSCKSVDDPREELVNESPLHVDVPEEDTVEGVVEHHVESLERAHDGYPDIAADLLAHLV